MTNIASNTKPLIVIVGPTASGKTSLAIEVAKKIGGEVISADSRAIYKGLDIGSAKPSTDEMDDIPHWGIDLAGLDQRFSVADFQSYAVKKIDEIRSRHKIPLLVGGSGLYIDAVIFDYHFPKDLDYQKKRAMYDGKSLEDLISHCIKNNIKLPENWKNKQYVINQIIRGGQQLSKKGQLIDNCFVFGIKTDRGELRKRIKQRIGAMFEAGVVDEAINLSNKYGWGASPLKGSVYPIIRRHLAQEVSYDEAVELAVKSDMMLVKKQLTWFRRYSDMIDWVELDQARKKIIQKTSGVLK